ncbi:hypothetical protein [Kitasatospora sp. NPDC057198]|uniref:hypothetical protein n=1 Tax=Kitasatospora sp. NPDC057198 TaxID=3346046 RepID=UPI00363566F5
MPERELSRDEVLRVLAALEAVRTGGDDGLRALLAVGRGGQPLAQAVAAYTSAGLGQLLSAGFGIHDGLGPEELRAAVERVTAGVGARRTRLLADLLAAWAQRAGDGLEQIRTIALTALTALQAVLDFSLVPSTGEVLPMIAQLGATALAT